MRLSARGPRAQAGLAGGVPRQDRGACARDRRWRAGAADRHALGGRRQALQRLLPARPRHHRGGAHEGEPAQLRRVRRAPPVCAGAAAGSGQLPRRAHRRPDLRGHLDGVGRLRGRGRVSGRDRSGAAGRAQRLAVLARQGGGSAQYRGRAGHRKRSAAHLCQPDRRPGRTGVRWRFVRAACRSLARVPAPGLRGDRQDAGMGAPRQWLALRRRSGRGDRRGRQGGLCRLHAGAARLRQQERLQGRGFRPLRRRQLRPGGGAGGRCPGRRPRAVRDAAVPLHVAGIDRRCGARSRRRCA